MRKLGACIGLLLCCIGVGKGWHWVKGGLHIGRLVTTRGEPLFAGEPLSPEVEQILGQPFFYLSRGHQCYAFESEDGRFVLKLPRMDRYRLPVWMRVCRWGFLEERCHQLKRDQEFRKSFLFHSFLLSLVELRDQTALIALHWTPTLPMGKTILLKDWRGASYSLPLDRVVFALQRKTPLLTREFEHALEQGDRSAALHILEALVDVVAARAKKGILNKDASFLRNFGYEEGTAFQIDIGSFYRKAGCEGREAYSRSLRDSIEPVCSWLLKKDPELAAHLERKLCAVLEKE